MGVGWWVVSVEERGGEGGKGEEREGEGVKKREGEVERERELKRGG